MVLDTLLDLNQRFGGVLAETVAELLPEEHEPRLAALALMLTFDATLILRIYDRRQQTHDDRVAAVRALVDMINRDARHRDASKGTP